MKQCQSRGCPIAGKRGASGTAASLAGPVRKGSWTNQDAVEVGGTPAGGGVTPSAAGGGSACNRGKGGVWGERERERPLELCCKGSTKGFRVEERH